MHLYSTKEILTLAQLVDAWSAELNADPAELGHALVEDAINGLFGEGEIGYPAALDDGSPGFGVLDESRLKELAKMVAATGVTVWRRHIFIKRQAALVFAARRRIAPPSWWAAEVVPAFDMAAELHASRTWHLAPVAIDHIVAAQQCTRQEACLKLQVPLLEGRIKAKGQLRNDESGLLEVRLIDSEFWRYALPEGNGTARNLSTLAWLPWFEVYMPEVLAVWPAPAPPAPTEAVASEPETTSLPAFSPAQATGLLKTMQLAGGWQAPPTEVETRSYLKRHFRGVPNGPHREIRRKIWGNQIRRGPRRKTTATE